MDALSLFDRDVKRALKENLNVYENLETLFSRSLSFLGNDASAGIFDYWKENYARVDDAPNENAIEKLCAFFEILQNENAREETKVLLTKNDWASLAENISFVADEIPLADLSRLMKLFVEEKALQK